MLDIPGVGADAGVCTDPPPPPYQEATAAGVDAATGVGAPAAGVGAQAAGVGAF